MLAKLSPIIETGNPAIFFLAHHTHALWYVHVTQSWPVGTEENLGGRGILGKISLHFKRETHEGKLFSSFLPLNSTMKRHVGTSGSHFTICESNRDKSRDIGPDF